MSVLAGVQRTASVQEAQTRISGLTADSAELYRSLADADAMATTGYVSGGREPTAVQARYDLIAADPRHTDLAVLLSEPIEERRFADWSMGYRPTTDELAEAIPGYADVSGAALDEPRSRADLEPSVRALLDWFRAPVPAGT